MITIDINGMIDEWGYMTSLVRYQLRKNANRPVTVRVNSYGGSVNEALNIAQAFADHGDVTCRLLAFNASAATWMVYGARRVEMADDAFWLCHRSTVNVDIWKDMNLNDLRQAIDQLQSQAKSNEAFDLMIAGKYIDKAKENGVNYNVEDILSLMNERRWLSAAEAHARGFVDAIVKNAKSMTDDAYNIMRQTANALNMPTPTKRIQKETVLQKMSRFLGFEKTQQEPDTETTTDTTGTTTDGTTAVAATEDPSSEDPQTSNINPQPSTIMNEQLTALQQLLGTESIAVNDGAAALNEQQLAAINERLQAAQAAQDELSQVQQTLDSLSEHIRGISGVNNKVLAVISLINRTPMTTPAGAGASPAEDEKAAKLKAIKDIAVDPVNEIAAQFRR